VNSSANIGNPKTDSPSILSSSCLVHGYIKTPKILCSQVDYLSLGWFSLHFKSEIFMLIDHKTDLEVEDNHNLSFSSI
jgi:hypothetical protein